MRRKPNSDLHSDRRKKATDTTANLAWREQDSRRLTEQMEKLATEMQSTSGKGGLDSKTLKELDELTELLRNQREALLQEAAEATDTLEKCRDEIQRKERAVDFERLRSQQQADCRRDAQERADRRKRAS